jgi:hypothetical protein
MDQVLAFLSDLIIFTFGLVVLIFWIVLFAIIAIEVWDLIFEKDKEETDVQDVR